MTRPARLLTDDVWHYAAPNGQLVPRRTRVYRTAPGRLTVVLTETPADHGMSITNAAADIHRQLHDRYPGEHLEHIEHWTATGGPAGAEHFDRVRVEPHGDVTWRRIPRATMRERFGPHITDPPAPV